MSTQTASRLDRWPNTTAVRESRAAVQVLRPVDRAASQADHGATRTRRSQPAQDAAEQARRALQTSLDVRQ